jgi:hypothetical protein
VVSARRSSSAPWGKCPAVSERDISKKVTGHRGPIAWPSRPPDLPPTHYFSVGTENVYAVPPRTIENFVARLQAAVTKVDVNILRRVRENAVRRTAVCLEMDGDGFQYLL